MAVKYGCLGLRLPTNVGLRLPTNVGLPCVNCHLKRFCRPHALYKQLSSRRFNKAHWDSIIYPVPNRPSIQSEWDATPVRSKRVAVLTHSDQHHRARILSASTFPSGAWLNAVPKSSTGNLLDDDAVRIATAHRLGLPFCQPHRCQCGTQIENLGLHPLCCRRSVGCCPRHHALSDVIKRTLDTDGFPSILEPTGLSREDCKRLDGVTLFPFSDGHCLARDSSCIGTFASRNLIRSALHTDQAAADAER